MPLTKQEKLRYSRQILLSNLTEAGQDKLKSATVTVIGLGALGSAITIALARSGVGKLRLVDRDTVELENLHRQLLYDEGMLGYAKASAAARRLKEINSNLEIVPMVKDVNFSTIETVVSKSDLILDGTDNLETRFLINDFSIKNGIPWIYGGVVGTQGMSMNILTGKDVDLPCFRCLVPELPAAGTLPTCDTYGILNTVPMIIGSLQATEAIKLIIGSSDINKNLIFYDLWYHEFRSLEIPKNKSCKCCVDRDYEYLNIKKRTLVTSICGQDSVQITPIRRSEKGSSYLDDLEVKLAKVGEIKRTEFTLEFKVEKLKMTIFLDGRVLIKGTTEDNIAKSLYNKYIGN
jgi:adenylyltransferase/sulfurtransferase